jgi:beta-lysine 5,6-aminomutase alpha subunit
MLRKVADIGMFEAIEAGMFADTVRTRDGGRGLDGVVRRDAGYENPIETQLMARLGLDS